MKRSFQGLDVQMEQLHIIDRIRRQNTRFSAKQQLVAGYLIKNHKQAAFLNSSKLARVLKVSQATLYRFAVLLGYAGFPQMQVGLQEMVLGELTTEDRLDLFTGKTRFKKTKQRQRQEAFERIVMGEIETMKTLLASLKKEDFARAVEMIYQAEKIFIIGLLGSTALAQYFAYNLRKLRPDVILIQHGDGEDFIKLRLAGPSSVVIIITFPRYPRLAVEFAALARRQEAKIIALTNNVLSPIAPFCDVGFYIDTQVTSFMDPFGAPITMIHALIAEFSQSDMALTKRRLKEYEEIAERERLFYP